MARVAVGQFYALALQPINLNCDRLTNDGASWQSLKLSLSMHCNVMQWRSLISFIRFLVLDVSRFNQMQSQSTNSISEKAPGITDQKRGNPWKNCETLRRHQQVTTFRKFPKESGTMQVPESSTFKGIRWQGDDEHHYTIKLLCVTFHAAPCLSRHPSTF